MVLHSIVFGEGEPLVILHGFLGMGDNWKTHGKRISSLGYQIHLVDQRNHGRSFHDDAFNYELMSDDLLRYCEHHGLKKFTLLGHSMGGKTAMFFTAENPEYVEQLVIVDISPRFYPVHHDVVLRGLEALDIDGMRSRAVADEELSAFVPEAWVRQFLLKNLYWAEKGQLSFRFNLDALTSNVAEVGEALPEEFIIETETLFLRGERSEYISSSDPELIAYQFPNSELVTIKEAGHWVHAENPEEFLKALKNFLSLGK